MTFRQKIMAVVVMAGVCPVLLLGVLSYRSNRAQLRETIGRLQLQAAMELARACSDTVLQSLRSLQLSASYLPFEQLQGDDLGTVLAIPYRQNSEMNVIALVDSQANALAPPFYSRLGEGEREGIDEKGLEAFSKHAPARAALEAGTAVGVPYRSGATTRLAVGVRAQGNRVLLGELSLTEMRRRVTQFGAEGGLAFVVGPNGAVVAHSREARELSSQERVFAERSREAGSTVVDMLTAADGASYLAAAAPIPELGWSLVIGRSSADAFAAADQVRLYTIYWAVAGVLMAAGLGFILSRGVSRPVSALAEVARAVAEGHYDRTVDVSTDDELGRLAATFNHMSTEIRRRDEEISAFNKELQQRVEDKTRELKEALDQVERSRRLAAIGSFSAGFSHELNTPLTGVLGLASLLDTQLRGTPKAELSAMLLQESRRLARVVKEMQALVQEQQATTGVRFPLLRPVEAALDDLRRPAAARNIELVFERGDTATDIVGDPQKIQSLVENLVRNAITAMPNGGRVAISISPVGTEAARLVVSDNGRGIPRALQERIFDAFFTTKDEPTAIGLGLSVAHRIVEAHHGRISVSSEEGHGATFTVVLPLAPAQAHLY